MEKIKDKCNDLNNLESILNYFRKRGVSDLFFKENDTLKYRFLNDVYDTEIICSNNILSEIFSFRCNDFLVKEDLDVISDYDYSIDLNGRYRVNYFNSNGKKTCVIRVINKEIPEIENLNLDSNLVENIIKNKGLNLFVGKTCSGKSTTISSICKKILETNKVHILTLEDPIEYDLESVNSQGIVNQRELGKDFNNFNSAIKSALRQNPDIIVVGEIRDKETMKTVLLAVESGITVISSFHSEGAKNTIEKIYSLFTKEERDLVTNILASELNIIQSQRLIKVFNKDKEELKLDYELLYKTTSVQNIIKENNLNELESIIILNKKLGMKLFSYK